MKTKRRSIAGWLLIQFGVTFLTLFAFLIQEDVQAQTVDICGRTDQVEAAILAAIPATNCATVTSAQLESITDLDLSGELIQTLQSGDFSGLTNLQTLNLVRNSLGSGSTPADIFAPLTNLRELFLHHNGLTALDADIFDGLTELTGLGLAYNRLTDLDADIFDGLTNLTGLSLANNALIALDANIFDGLTNLRELFLNNNALTELPAGIFSGLTSLEGVDVSGNLSIDPALFTLTVNLKAITHDTAAIEVVQGVPFDLAAWVFITSGTFSERGTTKISNQVIEVTIEKGATQSNPFSFTLTGINPSIGVFNLRINNLRSNPQNIDPQNIATGFVFDPTNLSFSGYSGFQLATGPNLMRDICSRTQQVQTAILDKINALDGVSGITCDAVPNALLAQVTGLLDLSGDGITTTLQPEDFAGLINVNWLNLSGNSLELAAGVFDGLQNLRGLDLRNTGLSALPQGIFSSLVNLETLYLNNNNIMELPEGIFSGSLFNLKTLNLNKNNIMELPARIFNSLRNLRSLDLSFNELTELPAGLFRSLRNLTAVDVSFNPQDLPSYLPLTVTLRAINNRLAVVDIAQGVPFTSVTVTLSITGGTFVNGTTQTRVTISKGQIQSTTARFVASSPLFTSTISIVNISSNPEDIARGFVFDITNLSSDGYSGFRFASGMDIQIGICGRTQQVQDEILTTIGGGVTCQEVSPIDLAEAEITELDLSGNGITTLQSGDFSGLTALTTLDLSSNDLEGLPADIFAGLTALERLSLANNRLIMLDVNIFANLASLTLLNLSQNSLEAPEENLFYSLSALTTLDLSGNSLMRMGPNFFGNLTALTSLDLSQNGTEILNGYLFRRLSALERLDLSQNSVERLNLRHFRNLRSLISLDLSQNSLETLDTSTFASLRSLTELNLSQNSLTLDANFFANLTALTSLDLSQNSLETLDTDIAVLPTSLEVLNLSGNNLTTLDADIFAGLTNLAVLNLSGNNLTTLPAGLFNGLTSLRAVDVSGNPNAGDSFILTATLRMTGDGEAVMEVVQGVVPFLVPFTVTATLSITRGNFSGSSTTNVTIATGNTQSAPFAYTMDPMVDTTIITVSNLTSAPGNILNEFDGSTGYSGFDLVEGEPLLIGGGICNRAPQVRDAILAAINAMPSVSGVTCDTVTDAQLAAISGILNLRDDTPNNDTDDITGLRSEDFAGLTSLVSLDLNGNSLSTLPADIFADLESLQTLNLSNNALVSLDANIFAALGNLQRLFFGANNLSTLPLGIFNGMGNPNFSGLGNLQTLGFAVNDLTDLPAGIFSGLGNLRTLGLGSNVNTLPAGIFSDLGNLQTLRLEVNDLTDLPEGIFSGLGNLRTLRLGSNSLSTSTLPANIFNGLTNLVLLNLSGNNLTELPAGLFSGLTNLSAVDVSDNPNAGDSFALTATSKVISDGMAMIEVVQGVPFTRVTATLSIEGGTFANGTNADNTETRVTIDKGQTQSAPFQFTPTELSTIITVSNLGSEPENILDEFDGTTGYSGFRLAGGAVVELVSICARTDQVETAILAAINASSPDIPATCSTVTSAQLQRILTLDLSDLTPNDGAGETADDITTLQSGDFAGLTNLEILTLDNNSLMTLPAGIFSGLNNLAELNLRGNNLTELLEGIFSDLGNLEILTLDNNSLMTLPANIFNGLNNLGLLNLSGNNLTTLGADIFAGLTSLVSLDLRGNDLTELPAGIFSGLTNLVGVDVSDNLDAGAPFTLTATLRMTGDGVAVMEVVQGVVPFVVPFNVTATLSITRGEFPDGTTSVTISKGQTQSAPFRFTTTDLSGVITVTISSPDNADIDDAFDGSAGYSGFELAEGTLVIGDGICNRTQQVQDGIVNAINNADPAPVLEVTCNTATNALLAAITSLDLSGQSIASLQSGDFGSLTALETLNLSDNALETMPEGIFAVLTNLTTLLLNDNALETLPAGIFAGLTNLTGVRVDGQEVDGTLITSLPLDLEIENISADMAAVAVAPGVPFTSVTATVSIIGGTFSETLSNEITRISDTEIEVTIAKGDTRSAAFAFTVTASAPMSPIIITAPSSEPENILDEFNDTTLMGYSGFYLTPASALEERIEEISQNILPSISRELVKSVQTAITGRINALTSSSIIPTTGVQFAGQATFSEFLLFSARTFDSLHNHNQSFSLEPLMKNTSFAIPLSIAENPETGKSKTGLDSIAFWGSGDYQNTSGGETISWDGDILSFHLGSDLRITQDILAGLSVSWSRGEFDYEDNTSGTVQEGTYELSFVSVHPYAAWTVLPWLDIWVLGGYGSGEVTIEETNMKEESDAQMFSGGLGIEAETYLEPNIVFPGITRLKLKGELSMALMDIEDNGSMINAVSTQTFQQRMALEGSHDAKLCWDAVLTPSLEIGIRNDSGDGETGNGLELGGGLRYVAPDYGLTVEASGRWLAVHSAEVEEWGIGGFIRFEPGAVGAGGFSFVLNPVWGRTASGVQDLWDGSALETSNSDNRLGLKLNTELGYGLPVGEGLLKSSAAWRFSEEGSQTYRLETRYTEGNFSLSLESEHIERSSGSPEDSLTLGGSIRF